MTNAKHTATVTVRQLRNLWQINGSGPWRTIYKAVSVLAEMRPAGELMPFTLIDDEGRSIECEVDGLGWNRISDRPR